MDEQKPRGSLGELCVRDPSKEPRKCRYFLATESNRTWKPDLQASQGRGAPNQFADSQDVLLFALPQILGPRESSPAECVEMQSVLPQEPCKRPLPFARRNRKVTWEIQPGPGSLSHPTGVTLSPFPVCVDEVFLGYLCLSQAPVDVAQKTVGLVCPHSRGEQVGWYGKSPGSTSCPGRLHALRGVSFIKRVGA